MPDRATDGYAWSKRMSEFAAEAFARQYGIKVAIARPCNVYGPGDRSGVQGGRIIPRLISQVLSGESVLTLWGTGEQRRTFLYVGDLARALLDLVETYAVCDPVNLGGAEEITIKGLAELVVRLSGREVQIRCDTSLPSGPQRVHFDVTKAQQILGVVSKVALRVGLERTIAMFRHDGGRTRMMDAAAAGSQSF
jgi:nucleoside-diphosphate-sugar epimerase